MAMERRTLLRIAGGTAVLGVAGFLVLTSPWTWSATHPGRDELPGVEGADLANGRALFAAGDCATCHMTVGQGDDTVLGGGRALDTAFGLFHMPNVSPDPAAGIGGWTLAEFDRAMREGVAPSKVWPDGRNLYPAFPYTSYQHMTGADVRDLYAYMMTLPAVAEPAPPSELKFPFNINRGVGVWRLAFLDGKQELTGQVPEGVDPDLWRRGQYLVEGPAHCAECHSPRNQMGVVIADQRFGGGPNAEGTGWVPNITPDETGIGFWSAAAIANYLHTGMSPIGRASDGDMAEIIANTSQLPFEDLQAMALYLKHVPAVDRPAPGMPEPNWTDQLVMLENAIHAAPTLPVSAEASITAGATATVVATKDVWLDAAGVGGGTPEQGKLLGGAPVTVAARDGDRVQMVLKGWQMADAPSVIYQSMGHRVMQAVLDDAAAAAVIRGEPRTDADTGQVWVPAELTVWSDAAGMNTDRQAVWAYGQTAYQQACAACHVLPQQKHFTANQWVGTMKSMRRFTSFSDDQYRLILAYLQNHSKDLDDGTVASVQ